jgi:hypothetical protein|tara:strand:- start:1187 stop:1585 length:399 start_codon:yes stop_codon:yes gene_type:complete
MENDLERLIVEREELEDRCMKLIDENKTLQNLRDRLAATESERDQHKKTITDLQEVFWSLFGDRIQDEISCAGVVENLVSEAIADYDITDNGYFEQAVNEVINNYDFDEIFDENLSDKVAQVIGDGEFIFRR